MSDTIQLFDEQKIVFDRFIEHVLDSKRKHQVLRIRAAAGTGKSFLTGAAIKSLNSIDMKGAVLSLTGRACAQLRKSMADNAQTLHSLLMKPVYGGDGKFIGFENKDVREIRATCGSYLAVDEGSMLPKGMYEHLLSVGLPLILIGDHNQLPAIDPNNPNFNTMDLKGLPTVSMDINRRTDPECDGIVNVYERLKKDNVIMRQSGSGLTFTPKGKSKTRDYFNNNDFDIVICGTNRTRHTMNEIIRSAKFDDIQDIPHVGEKIVCLKNSMVGQTKINNGELFTIEGMVLGDPDSTFFVRSIDMPESPMLTVKVHNSTWVDESIPQGLDEEYAQSLNAFGYGYALSVHKTQGSSFNKVFFFDEDVSFFLDRRKFRYTAVTRAVKHLTIAM